MGLKQQTLDYIERHGKETLQLLKTLGSIPAPSNHEEKRAAFCKEWLQLQGVKDVFVDEALNVVVPIGCTESNPLFVFLAHTDIVFPDTEELTVTERDGRLLAPGIGDDTASVAALMMVAKYLAETGLTPRGHGVLLVLNSGEEGLGNLRGSRQIVRTYGPRIREFCSFDSANGVVVDRSVGSRRYRVEVRTEGGHSYNKFGNRNAIACLASMITTLYGVKPPEVGKTTYNVGVIGGGTSVNTIAQQAEMLYEFRSDRKEGLDAMEKMFRSVVEAYRSMGITVHAELIGERPCMGEVDADRQKALVEKAAAAVREHFHTEPKFHSGSTDCNIPLAEGIPAVCVGCYFGDGAHTRREWVEIASLQNGLNLALDLILRSFG